MTEWLDIIVRILAIVGLPSVTAWFLYDRRRIRNQNLEQEETMPNRVRSSSVVTLEAEIMALSRSFDTDRRIKDETIQFLQEQLDERDKLIDSLQAQLGSLRRKVATVTRDLESVQHELDSLKRTR